MMNQKKKLVLLLVAAGLLLAALFVIFSLFAKQPQEVVSDGLTFQNPLVESGPDPWMTYYDGYYYLATTTWGGPFTGLTMRKAESIVALKTARAQRVWMDLNPSRSSNYWAPEFFLLDGPNGLRWYGYFTGGPAKCCDNQHIHVIESASTDPLGPYTYKGMLEEFEDTRNIDASLLQLNGSLYLLSAGRVGEDQNLYIAPMQNPWTLSGDRNLLSSPEYDWEKVTRNINQGPVALHHDDKTFIVYSASYCGGPGYSLGLLSYLGGDPLQKDSWSKSPQPVFQSTSEVFAPGHNTFFKSPDGTQDWIVYHANDSAAGACDMNRSPRAQPFTWNADGTPNFGAPLSVTSELEVPSG